MHVTHADENGNCRDKAELNCYDSWSAHWESSLLHKAQSTSTTLNAQCRTPSYLRKGIQDEVLTVSLRSSIVRHRRLRTCLTYSYTWLRSPSTTTTPGVPVRHRHGTKPYKPQLMSWNECTLGPLLRTLALEACKSSLRA